MPIKGLSTRDDVAPRFPTIGKLRKGGPKRNGQFGKDLDHFRFTSDEAGVVEAFQSIYGEEPDHLDVYLPFATMEENFGSWRETYGANGLVKIRCDGEYHVNWVEGDRYMRGRKPCTLKCKDVPNRCPDCALAYVGRLSVILEPLWRAGFIGLVTMETHAINDIGQITSKLVQHEPLTGKQFSLFRRDTRIGVPMKGKRAAVDKSLVYIELSQQWMVAQLEAARDTAFAQLNGHAPVALAAAVDEDAPTGEGHEPPEPPMRVDEEEIEGEVVAIVEAENADDDAPAEPDVVIEAEPYEAVPMPESVANYEHVIACALTVGAWGFKHAGNVMTAFANYDKGWKTLPPVNLWAALNERAAVAHVENLVPA